SRISERTVIGSLGCRLSRLQLAAGALAPLRSPLPGCGLARGALSGWAGASVACRPFNFIRFPDLYLVRREVPALLPSRCVSCTPVDARPVQLRCPARLRFRPWGPVFPESGCRSRSQRARTSQSDLTVSRVLWITSEVASVPSVKPRLTN